ncbi:MAG: carbamoyltransferase HypF [Acidimicrobiales bacterium]
MERIHLDIVGVVQGVGFRPYVHRLATELGLDGFVGNDSTRVYVEVEGGGATLEEFARRLVSEAPPLSMIESVTTTAATPTGIHGFSIVASSEVGGATTLVSPDVAVCDDCLVELFDPADRRYGHPFITCTNCGPRFTIICRLPYDRVNTTMAGFPLCPACRSEYEDPADRRYHAQPIGCHQCGPVLSFRLGDQVAERVRDAEGTAALLVAAGRALRAGAVVAVKGIGGYHLACDATSDAAVGELRARKGRSDKPFAVMVGGLDQADELAYIDESEAQLLSSPARPIVLARSRAGSVLSRLVAPGNPLVGLMLPNAPLHHLLFATPLAAEVRQVARLGPLVMTSGNHGGEPICYRDDDVPRRLGHLADGVLGHDRPIHVPCDDSVVRMVDGDLLPIRRSRGYAPLPVRMAVAARDVLAVGGELKNTFCVTTGNRAWVSQHIGDMENLETMEAFDSAVRQFCDMYRVTPTAVAVDSHPGYLTSAWARRHHPGILFLVQHHHAHVAAVMAEHGVDPGARVIGFAFDGTGYGTDGTMWGGEVLLADAESFTRCYHLRAAPLPGGDAAVRNPSRVALAHLWAAGIPWAPELPPVTATGERELEVLFRQLAAGVACVPTSSMGRLFDAVSSLLGLRHHITYEAQAAIELEVLAEHPADPVPDYVFDIDGVLIEPKPVLAGIVDDLQGQVDAAAIAAGFHHAVANLVVDLAARVRTSEGASTVVLAGGVFQNALLSRLARRGLVEAGFEVLTHRLVPPNDGGLALGQALIVSHRQRNQRGQLTCV